MRVDISHDLFRTTDVYLDGVALDWVIYADDAENIVRTLDGEIVDDNILQLKLDEDEEPIIIEHTGKVRIVIEQIDGSCIYDTEKDRA